MAGPIQTIPQGLLGLLQLKETGRNPRDLIETVQPTVEQFDFWINRNMVDLTGGLQPSIALVTATPGNTPFSTNPVTVPDSQAWWVDNFTIFGTLLAAETISVAPAWFFLGAPGAPFLLAPPFADVITARARAFAVSARRFWLQPHTALSAFVYDDLTAATITVNARVRGVALPI